MADTVRTKAALLALFANNESGNISAQDARDFIVSIYAHAESTSNPHSVTPAQIAAELADLTNVSLVGLTSGDLLTYDGNNWVVTHRQAHLADLYTGYYDDWLYWGCGNGGTAGAAVDAVAAKVNAILAALEAVGILASS